MVCLFKNGFTNQALSLTDQVARIVAHRRSELAAAWQEIEAARKAGHWVALLLDYELGQWLQDTQPNQSADTFDPNPRLTALVYARADPTQDNPTNKADNHNANHQPKSDSTIAAQYFSSLEKHSAVSYQHYVDNVETIRNGIARGDYYQINYTLPLAFDWPDNLEPEAAFSYLLGRHPVAHAACVQDGDRWVLSFSPELFVARAAGKLTVRPMKGTAPRCADPEQDQASATALQQSAKNRAENLMIVDLLRNDLGRISMPGSVKTSALFELEAYPSVWTMTSTVTAHAPDATLSETLGALFPCGSVTGAPKIAAMQAISTLENRRRGIYCGSVGWLAPDGDFSLNVAIRTIELGGNKAQFGVGGGIVYDSNPNEEWEECQWKARILNPAL